MTRHVRRKLGDKGEGRKRRKKSKKRGRGVEKVGLGAPPPGTEERERERERRSLTFTHGHVFSTMTFPRFSRKWKLPATLEKSRTGTAFFFFFIEDGKLPLLWTVSMD